MKCIGSMNLKTKTIKGSIGDRFMQMYCPECGCYLGYPIDIDLDTIGWNCLNCEIKIHKRKNYGKN